MGIASLFIGIVGLVIPGGLLAIGQLLWKGKNKKIGDCWFNFMYNGKRYLLFSISSYSKSF